VRSGVVVGDQHVEQSLGVPANQMEEILASSNLATTSEIVQTTRGREFSRPMTFWPWTDPKDVLVRTCAPHSMREQSMHAPRQ
jgi:hypothetical protein